jgi:hypothetical protein
VIKRNGQVFEMLGVGACHATSMGAVSENIMSDKVDAAADLRQRRQSDLRSAMKAEQAETSRFYGSSLRQSIMLGPFRSRPNLNRSSAKLSGDFSGAATSRPSCNADLIYVGAPPMSSAAWVGR